MEIGRNIRMMSVNVEGKMYYLSIGFDMTEDKMNNLLVITRGFLHQYVYVEMVLVECFMQSIEDSVKRKKCFRFETKREWNECKRELAKKIKMYDSYVYEEGFGNEYAITYYDEMKDDMNALRDKLAKKVYNLGFTEDAGLYANVIVLYNFLVSCISIYEGIMYRLKQTVKVDLLEAFKSFCPIMALEHSYKLMKSVLGKDYDKLASHVVNNAEFARLCDNINSKLFDKGIQEEAARNATEGLDDSYGEKLQGYSCFEDILNGNVQGIPTIHKKVS